MRRYTTPTITLTISDLDLTDYHTVTTLKQGSVELDLEDIDCTASDDGCVLETVLTQEQTAAFSAKKDIYVQVHFVSASGVASATNIKRLTMGKTLHEAVISYE